MAQEKETQASAFAQTIYYGARNGEIKFEKPEVIEEKNPDDPKLKIITTRYISNKLESKAHIQFDKVEKTVAKNDTPKNPRYIIAVMQNKKKLHEFSGSFARKLDVFLNRGPTKKRSVEMSEKETEEVSKALAGIKGKTTEAKTES